MIKTISAADLKVRLEGGDCRVLDVREYPEYAEAHLRRSELVPLGELKKNPKGVGTSGEVIVVCRSGRRAQAAAELLQQHGGCEPVVLDGGIEAWKQQGFPVAREKGPISLERQVRIAAGLLILTGLLVPGALPLTYFVGCGLIFAGVTDACAMGLLLAKLPWNRPALRRAPPSGG